MSSKKPPKSPKPQGTSLAKAPDSPPDAGEEFAEKVERELGPLIPETARKKVLERAVQIMVREEEQFSGPVPHPRHMQQYEDACPGAADRMIRMAENVTEAQIEFARTELLHSHADRKLGLYLGFGALALILIAAVVLALFDKPVMAGSILGLGTLGIVARFIDGRRKLKATDE